MDRPMILYRGTLKSCNYRCSYCPFAKHPMGNRELEQDQTQWRRFVRYFPDMARTSFPVPARGLMVVPYGEALIHPWYWEGLGILSAFPWMEAVGAQTNLSFSSEPSLAMFRQAGGHISRLRLWATFHPEMVTAEAFASSCRILLAAGVSLCAGAVGDPGNLAEIRLLRRKLPKEIYLWINRMDGLGRDYTQAEQEALLEIDPYFARELVPVPAEPARCSHRLFVEGSGRVRLCNISQAVSGRAILDRQADVERTETGMLGMERLGTEQLGMEQPRPEQLGMEQPGPEQLGMEQPGPDQLDMDQPGTVRLDRERLCRRKFCSCYLAYGGRDDFMNRILFGPYPLFRIPRRPRAVFLDIQGTLIPGDVKMPSASQDKAQESSVPAMIRAGLEALSREGIPLFFATTLPYREAMVRCPTIRHLFSGGIFSAGAYIRLEQKAGAKELVHDLDEAYMERLAPLKKHFRFRILPDRRESRLCKITLLRPGHLPWSSREVKELAGVLALSQDTAVRFFAEDCCLQIVSSRATKEQGTRTLCQWLGIAPEEAAAAGDSGEDVGMLGVTGEGV